MQQFWERLTEIVNNHSIIIDRPKNTPHPRYPQLIYPLDYGYLRDTHSMDSGRIDAWVGSLQPAALMGIIATVDQQKADAEVNNPSAKDRGASKERG